MQISNHNLLGAISAPSPNHSGRITPKFIVMHYTAGWTADSAVRTFQNRSSQVSAQVTVDKDGTIYQHVPFNVRAWHAGPSSHAGYTDINSHSIGIEIVNIGFLKKTADGNFLDHTGKIKTPAQVGPVVAARSPRAGSGTFYWPAYPEAQLDAVEELTAALIAQYGIIDIVSHEEIDTRGWKTDPGPAFPMNRFKALLNDRGNDTIAYEVTASSLNMRSGPGTSFATNGKLTNGTRVNELGRSGVWVRVDSDSWVHGGYLRRVA